LFAILTQGPSETFSLMSQQLMLDIILNLENGKELDINAMRVTVAEYAAKIIKDEDYDKIRDQLKTKCLVELQPPAPVQAPAEVQK
jgi:hypothetical protein